jgi:hypothetical protein
MKLRYATLISALLIIFGMVSRIHAQTTVSLLVNAHAILAHADHDYDGHRAMAMKEIQAAIHDLAGTAHVKTRTHTHVRYYRYHPTRTSNKEPENQNASDYQVRTAENLLEQASTGLSGDAYQHVTSAIAQLNTALSVR